MKNKKYISKFVGFMIGIIPFLVINLYKSNWMNIEFITVGSLFQIAKAASILFFVASVLIGYYFSKFQLKMITIFNIILSATFSYLTIKTYPYFIADINIYIIFSLILFSSILLFIGFCVGYLNKDFNV